jgi:hypothetical protein
MKSSIEEQFIYRLDNLKKDIISLPKSERQPLKQKYKQMLYEFRDICSHLFISQVIQDDYYPGSDKKRICERCGSIEYDDFEKLKSSNLRYISYSEYLKIRKSFGRYLPC